MLSFNRVYANNKPLNTKKNVNINKPLNTKTFI